jgi:hypothetical protein
MTNSEKISDTELKNLLQFCKNIRAKYLASEEDYSTFKQNLENDTTNFLNDNCQLLINEENTSKTILFKKFTNVDGSFRTVKTTTDENRDAEMFFKDVYVYQYLLNNTACDAIDKIVVSIFTVKCEDARLTPKFEKLRDLSAIFFDVIYRKSISPPIKNDLINRKVDGSQTLYDLVKEVLPSYNTSQPIETVQGEVSIKPKKPSTLSKFTSYFKSKKTVPYQEEVSVTPIENTSQPIETVQGEVSIKIKPKKWWQFYKGGKTRKQNKKNKANKKTRKNSKTTTKKTIRKHNRKTRRNKKRTSKK